MRGLLRPLSGGLALALIGLIAIDAVVVSHRRTEHSRRSAHQRLVSAELAYLESVRRVAERLPAEVLPVQAVLRALGRPHAGDVYAARDALSRPEALRALAGEVGALRRLHPPVPLQRQARPVVAALDQMRVAVLGMHQLHDVLDPQTLNLDIQSTGGSGLSRALNQWRHGLQALFSRAHETPPSAPPALAGRHAPATLMLWTFAADRACLRAHLHAAPLVPGLRQRPVDLDAAGKLGQLTIALAHRLRHIPRPTRTQHVPPAVTSRLVSLLSWGQALVDETGAARRGDPAGVQRAYDRFRTSSAVMPLLAKGFRGLHAIACATYVATGRGARRHHAVAA